MCRSTAPVTITQRSRRFHTRKMKPTSRTSVNSTELLMTTSHSQRCWLSKSRMLLYSLLSMGENS